MAQVAIKLRNGHKIVAPAEVWVWAMFESMTSEQAQKVVDKIIQLKSNTFATQRIVDEIAPGGKAAIIIGMN